MNIGVDIRKLTLFILFLLLSSKIKCEIRMQRPALSLPSPPVQSRPLCPSQLTLVNHACAMLPFYPAPPIPRATTPPVSSDSPPRQSDSHSQHAPPRPRQMPVEQECCRWLKVIDSACVCDLLVRLPVFLAKPVHQYTVKIDGSCTVTYSCSGRIISP